MLATMPTNTDNGSNDDEDDDDGNDDVSFTRRFCTGFLIEFHVASQ